MQAAFVSSIKGMDNVIIAREILHTMSGKKGNVGFMNLKIDLEKDYDNLRLHLILY